jgi:ABC-type transport system involved in Fe-S cluster assembly fused permease/ATPase subunit
MGVRFYESSLEAKFVKYEIDFLLEISRIVHVFHNHDIFIIIFTPLESFDDIVMIYRASERKFLNSLSFLKVCIEILFVYLFDGHFLNKLGTFDYKLTFSSSALVAIERLVADRGSLYTSETWLYCVKSILLLRLVKISRPYSCGSSWKLIFYEISLNEEQR